MNATLHMSPEYLAEDNSASLMRTCIAFLVLETVFIILLYASRFTSGEQKTNWYMVLMTGAYLVCVSKITLAILSVKIGGSGRHTAALTPATLLTGLKLNTAFQIVCPLTTSLSKLSVLCLLDAILGQASQTYRRIIRGTFVLVLLIMLVQVLIPFVNCRPFSMMWDLRGSGTCTINSLSLWRYLSIPNVVTTLFVICIPLPAMYKLKVSSGTKLGLVIVFLVCIGGIVAATMRLRYFLEVRDFQDLSFDKIKALFWTVVESGIYLMAGVMLTLRPLVRKMFGNMHFDSILSRTFGGSGTAASWMSRRWSKNVLGGYVFPTDEGERERDSERRSADDEKMKPVMIQTKT